MNEHAQALGRLAKGKRKTLTAQEIEARTAKLTEARKLRWLDKECPINIFPPKSVSKS
jgi:hypothetical protein